MDDRPAHLNKKIYTGNPGPQYDGALDRGAASADAVFSSMRLPAIGSLPNRLTEANGKRYFTDDRFGSLGTYDPVAKRLAFLPLSTPPQAHCMGGIVVDSSGTPWLACQTSGAACVESVALTSTWNVFPSQGIVLYTSDGFNSLPPGRIGIGETGNSGPFKVTSSNRSVCLASVIAGFDHNIQINPIGAGGLYLVDHRRAFEDRGGICNRS